MDKVARIERKVVREIARVPSTGEALEVIDEVKAGIEKQSEAERNYTAGVPGTVWGNKKQIYTYQKLCEIFPIVTFTPEETVPLTFNGVRVQALANIEMHVPKCFKDIYDQHRKPVGAGVNKEFKVMGINIEEGAGGL